MRLVRGIFAWPLVLLVVDAGRALFVPVLLVGGIFTWPLVLLLVVLMVRGIFFAWPLVLLLLASFPLLISGY